MNIQGDYDDYQRFVDELTEAIESGYTYEHDEIVGFDATRATLNVIDHLTKWGLINFIDEN
jgi:hypothetical protein